MALAELVKFDGQMTGLAPSALPRPPVATDRADIEHTSAKLNEGAALAR